MAASRAAVEPDTSGVVTNPDTKRRLENVEDLTQAILIIVAVTLVGIVLAGYTLVLDQEHFNNELYRDGSYVHTKTVVQYQSPPTTYAPLSINPAVKPKQ